jgi:4-aminobutyrate aminotransferase
MALTGKVQPYKAGFGISPGGVFHVPFPDVLRGVTAQHSLDAIQGLFKADIAPTDVAAIVVEPVQGEGGFNIAPPELMRGLRKLCDAHGILLIADEVQTGFARTGKLFAMEHHDVRADLITMAKSLAGGMPLSGVVGRAAVMDAPTPGGLGGTYAGNPLAIASALAVLEVIDEEALLDRSTQLGARLLDRLNALTIKVPQLAQARGVGAMVAAEFAEDDGTPLPAFTKRVQELALQRGLLLLTCGTHGNVVRFLFPLTIADALFDEALDLLDQVLVDAANGVQ